MLYTVLTTSRSPGISSGLTYESKDESIKEGTHVSVSLRNQLVEGIVIDVIKKKQSDTFDIKDIAEVLGNKPLLTKPQLQTLQWMSKYYFCSLRQALRVWLPTPSWKNLAPKNELYFKLIDHRLPPKRSFKQTLIVEYLKNIDWASQKELKDMGAEKSTLKTMLTKGRITMEERKVDYKTCKPVIEEPNLTKAQTQAYQLINRSDKPSLLFGITSSGKTEIYAQLISDAVKKGKQAILLVPEILLTEHCIHRFEELIGKEHIAVVHSRLTAGQRRKEWRRIHNGGAHLVIGSRSALFAPVPNLGVVIIDEEHEWTYKNEQTPRYHARETAAKLCEFAKAKLIMGTATPSVESWARAKFGEYQLVNLPERYQNHPLPDVRVVDLTKVNFGKLYPFSPPLLNAIEDRLKKGEQSVLFLNRRGSATSLMCFECRRRIVSPESNLPFTVHKDPQGKPYLLDHTSGIQASVPVECPACKSTNLHAVGAGTQKIEDILSKQFPNARLLRADSDTLTHPEHMRLLLKKMREGHADILLGTQSVVKGLDLPNVTLAAVLIADVGLSLPHFRAGERIFQLLTQLTGRSGRAKPGEVIIQTFRPDSAEVKYAANHQTKEFLNEELKLRLHAGYPPATNMIRLIIREDARTRAIQLVNKIKAISNKDNLELKVSSAPQMFGGGRSWHVLIRGVKPSSVLNKIDLKNVVVDIDPMECV